MANEHIGRRQAIGLGKESTSGTAVAAATWIPKAGGSFSPKFGTAVDEAAYGVIDSIRETQTVKQTTEVTINAALRDKYFGDILLAAFGLEYSCVKFPIPGAITGTYVEGETITESTSTATGTLRRLDGGGSSKVLYIVPASGTFTGGQTLTGGTSGPTATGGTIESPAAVRFHIFRRLNTNTPVSYTIYGSDPVGDERATYCALDKLEIEAVVGDFAKFTASFLGKKIASTSTQTPSFTSENPFLAKFATFKNATAFTGLDAAAAVSIERFKLTIEKNVVDYQAFGNTDVASIHNQDFKISGDFTLLYNAITMRDLVAASTKQAFRLTLANTDVTIGSAANPTFQLDIPVAAFSEWSRTDEANSIVKQTLAFNAEFDTTRSMTAECLLANARVTAY